MSWLQRHRGSLATVIVSVLICGALVLLWGRPAPGGVEVILPPATTSPAPTPTAGPLRVYVSGAVVHPDVYLLAAGSIVKDAVVMAGGPVDEADLDRINLALALQDQAQVYVPFADEAIPATIPPLAAPAATSAAPSRSGTLGLGLVNVNTATAGELEALPGIGPALAERIIVHRPYAAVGDLLNVPGIGEKTLAGLEGLVTAP